MTQEQYKSAKRAIEVYRDGANYLSEEWELYNNTLSSLTELYESSLWYSLDDRADATYVTIKLPRHYETTIRVAKEARL